MKAPRAFTLLELLVAIAIVAVLAVVVVPALQHARFASWRAVSAQSLRQLGAAGNVYCGEHDGAFWKYREDRPEGTVWWFGYEGVGSQALGEGERSLDPARGPLGAALISGGVTSDPAFLAAKPRHKPKFKNGNYGYGYNSLLGGGPSGRGTLARQQNFEHPGEVVVFATCAQVNTFQLPATSQNPMIEEFYLINEREVTVHFRYGGKALALMMNGSVRELPPDPATIDQRMPTAQIGRFAPVGNRLYLGEPK
jgi:prepilin-type N-terminal cleavage/methylation domain-containing protein